MTPRVNLFLRVTAAAFSGLVVSTGVNFAICRFGGDQACRNLIWPAAVILGTGFEGQLFAWGVTALFTAALFGLGFFLLFTKIGLAKRE
jgi:hypothetical protein